MSPEGANKQVTKYLKTKMNMLLACGHSNHWWLALVCEVNNDYSNFMETFMLMDLLQVFIGLSTVQFFRAIWGHFAP